MSSQERNIQERFQTLIAFTLLLFIAMFAASCGGGASPSGTVSPSPSPTAGTVILKADAGSICETLLAGASYSKTPPKLSCHGGASSTTAYLDGSKSTSSDGSALTYAWTFVSTPTGSTATLSGADTAKPTFVPDKAGAYAVQLVVSANGVSSPRSVTVVVALDDATLNPDPATNRNAASYTFHGGLSNNCSACHTATYPTLPSKTSTHISTSNMCQSCHSPLGYTVLSFVDHNEVFGTCSSCHDGIIAIGKSPAHLLTTQECSDCHSTTNFLDIGPGGKFDHSTPP